MIEEEKKYSKKDLMILMLSCVDIFLIFVLIWAFSRKTNEQFVAELTFAATVSSIILSIVAIFMSISGEAKTASIRDKIEKEAEEIESTSNEMKSFFQQLDGKVDLIKSDTRKIVNATLINSQQEACVSQTPNNFNGVGIDNVEGENAILSVTK